MGLFSKELSNVVEWEEFRDDMIFWKWSNREIKKGSKLIIRPGQDAIFLNNGRIEGIFKEDGDYDIESQIIPFLSTLKGFKFGFNSGMRAEVLFVNTKEFQVRWGTRGPINLPHPQMPGGLPVRANGTFTFKINDYVTLIDKIAGVKNSYTVEDVRERITAVLDQLLMKWIVQEGKDMFNLMANSYEISKGIKTDLDMELISSGLTITAFTIGSINYPESVQKMIDKVASQGMVGDVNRYQQISMTDGIANGNVRGGGMASDMAGMMMGMQMANQMMNQMNNTAPNNGPAQANGASNTGAKPNFCPNCGTKTDGANFCPNCGQKL
ncbi:SPFH domain-containing protein [[Clostridium] polysaccharolyticum]|uniref:Membrane protease subunit, stomatin/prohibitin family, contains C-terminal Zn-ribbon domain n=1 Tax=[Clostridium] polysaccharolyticum TaxID=29364 RepID=A0A1I0DVG6_9FIRM|nr:SPFH domain-containing protein [[Clostridium] polysaccharolyticum]SET35815.1 Membrane protease subunit, stomatin/prohibitin family, contains C-terminal Zn-ribbon domain [[Clostridium] polysaccharolyticum]